MSDRQAIIVVGPEASGNRYLVRVLMHHGFYGTGDYETPFDHNICDIKLEPKGGVKLYPYPRIVFHRSFPHGGKMPMLDKIKAELKKHEYNIFIFVMHRNYAAVLQSQLKRHVKTVVEGVANIEAAYRRIYLNLLHEKLPYQTVCHSDLGDPNYMSWMLGSAGVALKPGYEPFKNEYAEGVRQTLGAAKKRKPDIIIVPS